MIWGQKRKVLKLDNIKKQYQIADTKIHALKGVSLNFEKVSLYLSSVLPAVEKQPCWILSVGWIDILKI